MAEAAQAAVVAQSQLAVAQAGLVVAGLQRQAALLRHEFAVQNLNFLRNRTLNAELWYRLSGAIRSVADTYLRYAIEMAFLAEQAYEFEADKRINVIRFDYDVSDLGDMLAGDFLLRDLDTLEQDLIVGPAVAPAASSLRALAGPRVSRSVAGTPREWANDVQSSLGATRTAFSRPL